MFLSQALAITLVVRPGIGMGLKAAFFGNADLNESKLTRTDTTVNFDWGKGAPTSKVGSDRLSLSTSGKTYYVSENGDDKNDGLRHTTPFRTLQRAANQVTTPGDKVYVMNGTYTRADTSKEILVIYEKHGTPTAPITFKAYHGHRPVIKSQNPYAINVVGSSYIVIDGLELVGNNDNVTLVYAQQQKDNIHNPLTNGAGIALHPSFAGGIIKQHSHHIVIRNNKISKFGAGAIGAFRTDYVTIENNLIFKNCLYSSTGANTITTLHNWNYDDNTTDYKMIIRGNTVYDNQSLIPWKVSGTIAESNGIMIDDALNTQKNSLLKPYRGKTLIANNIVYNNGAAGIQVFKSPNVDVINNTTYQNSHNSTTQYLGEIAVVMTENVRVFNNIMYAKKNGIVNHVNKADNNVKFDYNLIYNSSKFTSSELHNIIGQNPLFVDIGYRNFSLKLGSLAIDAGTSAFNGVQAPMIDKRGASRPQDGNGNGDARIDIGAFEARSPLAAKAF
ncbi:MAG: right-handed parallel beta-helix repeat-containing protein [Komarekiella atlantica HA4396-MV6]|jgi:hypothetical protein|nr:right-handed parallel beta-helix repeat-containing protein [Komarekiella atlantica HA4396-MV6]